MDRRDVRGRGCGLYRDETEVDVLCAFIFIIRGTYYLVRQPLPVVLSPVIFFGYPALMTFSSPPFLIYALLHDRTGQKIIIQSVRVTFDVCR